MILIWIWLFWLRFWAFDLALDVFAFIFGAIFLALANVEDLNLYRYTPGITILSTIFLPYVEFCICIWCRKLCSCET